MDAINLKNRLSVLNDLTGDQAEEAKQLARKARADYMRRYRREHPDTVRRANEAYWLRRAIREARSNGWEEGGE